MRKLHEVIITDQPNEEERLRVDGELVQALDNRRFSLIIKDAKNDGKDIEIPWDHCLDKSVPRILSLYIQLTSIKMTKMRQ